MEILSVLFIKECKFHLFGEMAEWLKAHAWKVCKRETVSWVRILLSPPFISIKINLIAFVINNRLIGIANRPCFLKSLLVLIPQVDLIALIALFYESLAARSMKHKKSCSCFSYFRNRSFHGYHTSFYSYFCFWKNLTRKMT